MRKRKCKCGNPVKAWDMCGNCYANMRRRQQGIPPRPKGDTMITVTCAWCGKRFERTLSHFNYNESVGRKHTCNYKCRTHYNNAVTKGLGKSKVMYQCAACGNVCERPLGQYNRRAKEGKADRMTCGRRCAGFYTQGKRYEGTRMTPRLIENMKVGT